MLDQVEKDYVCVGNSEFEWGALSRSERCLIQFYRRMTEQEQQALLRLTNGMVTAAIQEQHDS
jgi:hypothetical protein